ncbi:MAG: tripartite tricarboxylate transporter substrate binding protein [Alphaproteobacteria bacterium]|nr:tripartite tricarboxylate transporter substrate binding protein [Alphaproteobacteria bacterium]
MRGLRSAMIGAAFAAAAHTPVGAQADLFAGRPITLVVSYPAGGLSDLPARALAPELQMRLGVPVVIENRVGGSGMVAGAYVARAEPSGNTLLVTSSANVTNPQGMAMPYDVVADFAPVGMILEGPALILISNPTKPYKSVAELIAYGKANPGKLSFGSSGAGTVNALAIAQLGAEAGIDIVDVPYRGITQAGIAVVAGEIDGAFVFQGAAMPLVADNKVRGLASTAQKRDPGWPELPTMVESGFPKFVHQGFVGLVAPAKTPPAVVALLNKHVNEIVRTESFRARFAPSGMHPVESNSPADFGAYIRRELDRNRDRTESPKK